MASTWKSVDVRCPFYKEDEFGHSIRCEGPVEASSIQTCFTHPQSWKAYMDSTCCANYRTCPLYRTLLEGYEP